MERGGGGGGKANEYMHNKVSRYLSTLYDKQVTERDVIKTFIQVKHSVKLKLKAVKGNASESSHEKDDIHYAYNYKEHEDECKNKMQNSIFFFFNWVYNNH